MLFRSYRTIRLRSTIRLPVILIEGSPSELDSQSRIDVLAIVAGGSDELPQGPGSFAVMDDGSYLVADPVRKRLAIYDSKGSYRSQWPIGFAAGSVSEITRGLYRVVDAQSSDEHVYDDQGRSVSAVPAAAQPPLEAMLTSPTQGVITGGQPGKQIKVILQSGTERLISLQPLSTGGNGAVYVAMEVGASGGESISVSKRVRKYSPGGELISEVTDIPLDYYLVPNDELRLDKDVLYQMAPSRTEIRMNSWDMK